MKTKLRSKTRAVRQVTVINGQRVIRCKPNMVYTEDRLMPWDLVMHKFKHGTLKSGGGGKVKSRKQAIAIMMSEKRAAAGGKKEYKSVVGKHMK